MSEPALFDIPQQRPPAASTEPAWVRHYETTHGTPPKLSQRARPQRCRDCGRRVLYGLDHHRVAGEATIDPYRATPADEAAAILLHLPTYWLAGSIGTWEIEARYWPHIGFAQFAPTPTDQQLVVIGHACGKPPIARAPLPAPDHAVFDPDGPIPF
ncbi:hypothetical protein [Ruania rhizosphaerae]|uniref:hypothetical protein n=1 Tax=Ruania rhizosphaerae TaxID=1840413 RepID=UPI001356EBF9|nr:hypothetical protein [Ruania rhizosphaerae]